MEITGRLAEVAADVDREDDIPAVRLVNFVVAEAQKLRASDIHIDPQNDFVRVRYRIDGALKDFHRFPRRKHEEIISRIKIIAKLRTDEHQIPQDGRFRMILPDQNLVDVRVSVSPTYHGENAVLRLLGDNAESFDLETLGFSKENASKVRAAAQKSNGMILATGPTGSGKTTTLYALLKQLNREDVSIVTIEDPVEYAVAGIRQIPANPRANLTFANGLRGILRQDPNIIMVGEIRDNETAGIAVNAALTGHLLLSTLHTNDAAAALPRLLDMKVESYLIASTINIIIAQRLARKICPHCKIESPIGAAEAKSLAAMLGRGINERFFWRGRGCPRCNHSGYLGRIGIHEVLFATPTIREAVLRREPSENLKTIAVGQGMAPMAEDAFLKVCAGIISIGEMMRILSDF